MAFVSNLAIAFECVAKKHNSRPALLYPETGREVTYGELNEEVQHLARAFYARGLRRGNVVAIFHDKSPKAYAAMFACLRLGVIYTNLDPESPWERLRKILTNCKPKWVINAFPELPHADVITSGDLWRVQDLADFAVSACDADVILPDVGSFSGGTPAYIMFTSGSTGQPKGAVMSHANILLFSAWAHARFSVTQEDIFTNVNPIYFDNSVFDVYVSLLGGAALVPFLPAQVRDSRNLVRLVSEAGCTIWFSVPSLLVYLLTTRAVGAKDFPQIRSIIFGGEGFPKAKLKQLFDLFGSRIALENVYGPTECSCICSAYTISLEDFDDMQTLAPLGSVAQNFDGMILPQDPEEPDFGELFLCGPHVGLGYFNDPERTAASFIQNPGHALYADVGYRTGDLVRRDAEGRLHFKGRLDFQIKHLGYRIELEEIEAALATLADVKECAAIYKKLGDGLGEILAYVATDTMLKSADVISAVTQILPPYMVPKHILILDILPKNANGKIDRQVLLNQNATPKTA